MALFSNPTGLNKKALQQLLETAPIEPKHQPPVSLTGAGSGGYAEPHELLFFDWFDLFHELANRQMSNEPWRFQQISDTLLDSSWDSPSYGRCYDIFYNQKQVGKLEVSAGGFGNFAHHDFSLEAPYVTTDLRLKFVRVLPYDDVIGFLDWVASWLAVDETKSVPMQVRMTNLSAMTACLWPIDGELDDPAFRELEVHWSGQSCSYISWRQHSA